MILVTGATGFLGAELVHQLTLQGNPVVALKRSTSVVPELIRENTLIKWAEADINDLATLDEIFEDISQVYHCAAMVSFHPADKNELLRINIEGTSNIVNLCHNYGAKLLHVSSVAALGQAKKGMPITEGDFWEYDSSVSTYAISKYEGEMEVWRGITEGLEAIIVNPAIIIGANAGFKGSGALFKRVKDGLSFHTPGITGFVDVKDVARAMILLMNRTASPENGESGERFIISAENYSYQDFFTAVARGFKMKPPHRQAKPWMLNIAWRTAKLLSFFTRKPAGLTSETARSSMQTNVYSNAKIVKTLDIKFKPLHESIADTCSALFNQV